MPAAIDKATLLAQLEQPYNLPANAKAFYQEYGYVKLKNVLSAEVLDFYGRIISDQVIELNTLTKPMAERTTYEKTFLQITNLWHKDETVKEFAFSKRLAKIATDLMGVTGVRMYHDQALSNAYQRADWEIWLSSKAIGTTPDGPLNPGLFSY